MICDSSISAILALISLRTRVSGNGLSGEEWIGVVLRPAAMLRGIPLLALEHGGKLVERHPPARLVIAGRQAGRQVFVHGDQVGAAVHVGEGDGTRHLAAQRGVRRLELIHLELIHLDDLLVRHELHEDGIFARSGGEVGGVIEVRAA